MRLFKIVINYFSPYHLCTWDLVIWLWTVSVSLVCKQHNLYLLQVKSVVPFSEPFTVDPANPPPEKDYDIYFKDLKEGITGKEALQQSPVSV